MPCDISLLPATQLSPTVEEHRSRIVKQIELAQSLAHSNIARSQQLNKLQYDKTALDAPFAIGQRVWIYTPKVKSGLSKKFLARWYGPYRICRQLSPVHYQVRTCDNRLVATTVHANRLKPFYDPADQPILPPPLSNTMLFLWRNMTYQWAVVNQMTPLQLLLTPTPSLKKHLMALLLILQISLLTLMFTKQRKYSSLANTEEKFSTLSSGLTTLFWTALGSLKNTYWINGYWTTSTTKLSNTMSVLFFFCFIFTTSTALETYNYDMNGKHVTYYPESLMLSYNPEAVVFYDNTYLYNFNINMRSPALGKNFAINNTCSKENSKFLTELLAQLRTVQRSMLRILSSHGYTSLIECDSYIRRYYQYATGLTSTMTCPYEYKKSLTLCKRWALQYCHNISHKKEHGY